MNNRGFTLVELLAVLAIIAIIGMIAVPNVISIVDNNKKDLMLQDAQKMVSLAKAEVMKDRVFRDDPTKTEITYKLRDLDTKDVLKEDPDGGTYNLDSYVKYKKATGGSGTSGYCVYLAGSKRTIKAGKANSNCVSEENLSNRTYVFYN